MRALVEVCYIIAHLISHLFLFSYIKKMLSESESTRSEKRKAREITPPERFEPNDFKTVTAYGKPITKRLKKRVRKSPTFLWVDGKNGLNPNTHKYHPYLCHKPFLLMTQKGQCNLCSITLCPFDTEVDHIIPKKNQEIFGLELLNSRENLQAICGKCHNIKTQKIDGLINHTIEAKTPLTHKFEDAVGYIRLFMTQKHAEIRNLTRSYGKSQDDKKNSLVDNGYESDFSAHSYDSDAEEVDLDALIVLDQTDVDSDNDD
jgi:5-methylcytosine-specific restriction endonuclease McrA